MGGRRGTEKKTWGACGNRTRPEAQEIIGGDHSGRVATIYGAHVGYILNPTTPPLDREKVEGGREQRNHTAHAHRDCRNIAVDGVPGFGTEGLGRG